MGWKLAAIITVAALLSVSCNREARLDGLAQVRLAQLETCHCVSHDGFESVQGSMLGAWKGETVASSDQPITLIRAIVIWLDSPTHREVLTHPIDRWGFATSIRPIGGSYYAVMLVEDD